VFSWLQTGSGKSVQVIGARYVACELSRAERSDGPIPLRNVLVALVKRASSQRTRGSFVVDTVIILEAGLVLDERHHRGTAPHTGHTRQDRPSNNAMDRRRMLLSSISSYFFISPVQAGQNGRLVARARTSSSSITHLEWRSTTHTQRKEETRAKFWKRFPVPSQSDLEAAVSLFLSPDGLPKPARPPPHYFLPSGWTETFAAREAMRRRAETAKEYKDRLKTNQAERQTAQLVLRNAGRM